MRSSEIPTKQSSLLTEEYHLLGDCFARFVFMARGAIPLSAKGSQR